MHMMLIFKLFFLSEQNPANLWSMRRWSWIIPLRRQNYRHHRRHLCRLAPASTPSLRWFNAPTQIPKVTWCQRKSGASSRMYSENLRKAKQNEEKNRHIYCQKSCNCSKRNAIVSHRPTCHIWTRPWSVCRPVTPTVPLTPTRRPTLARATPGSSTISTRSTRTRSTTITRMCHTKSNRISTSISTPISRRWISSAAIATCNITHPTSRQARHPAILRCDRAKDSTAQRSMSSIDVSWRTSTFIVWNILMRVQSTFGGKVITICRHWPNHSTRTRQSQLPASRIMCAWRAEEEHRHLLPKLLHARHSHHHQHLHLPNPKPSQFICQWTAAMATNTGRRSTTKSPRIIPIMMLFLFVRHRLHVSHRSTSRARLQFLRGRQNATARWFHSRAFMTITMRTSMSSSHRRVPKNMRHCRVCKSQARWRVTHAIVHLRRYHLALSRQPKHAPSHRIVSSDSHHCRDLRKLTFHPSDWESRVYCSEVRIKISRMDAEEN